MNITILNPRTKTFNNCLLILPYKSSKVMSDFKNDCLVLRLDNCTLDSPEGFPATLNDVERSLVFCKRFKGSNLNIWSEDLALSLTVSLGIRCSQDSDIRECIFNNFKEHIGIFPNMWMIQIYDFVLGFRGKLLSITEEYTSTGMIVSNKGEVISDIEEY